jgi:hypothetical protein
MIAIAETIKIGTIGIVCFHEKTATATAVIGLVVFHFPMQIRYFFVSFYKENGI